MLTTINFVLFFFWFIFFIFIFNINNFFKLIVFSEAIWIVIYVLTTLLSSWANDLNLLSLTLFILGFAAIELSIGLILMIYFNKANKSLNFKNNNKNFDILIN